MAKHEVPRGGLHRTARLGDHVEQTRGRIDPIEEFSHQIRIHVVQDKQTRQAVGPKHLVVGTVHGRVQSAIAQSRPPDAQDHDVLKAPALFFCVGQDALMPGTAGGQGLKAQVMACASAHRRQGHPRRLLQSLHALFRQAVLNTDGVGRNVRPID